MDESSDVWRGEQEDRGIPPVLRMVVMSLAVLAVVTAAGGTVAGFVAIWAGGGTALLLVRVFGCFLAGWAIGVLLWASAWMLRQQYELAAAQRRILDMLTGVKPEPFVSLEPEPGPPPLPVPVVSVVPEPAGVAAEEPGPTEGELLRHLLDEVAELKADLLLTPEQREVKRKQIEQRRAQDLADRTDRALRAGEYSTAERLLGQLAEAFPDHPRVVPLRRRLADKLAEGVELSLRSGNLALAEKLLDRLAQAYDAPDHVTGLRQRMAQYMAGGIAKLIERKDFAGAEAALAQMAKRYGDCPTCQALRQKLSGARSAVQNQEIGLHRRRVEELMAVAAFDKAEAVAQELVDRHPESREAIALRDLVRREAAAFRSERRGRLMAEIQRFAEARQWRHAIDAARRLIEAHGDCPEAKEVAAQMATMEENAKIEEVREMRDVIQDRIRRRRYEEAAEIAREVIRRFPETQAAIQLREQLPRLQERVAAGEGHHP